MERTPVKAKANLFTAISIVWTLFSLFGLFDIITAQRPLTDPHSLPGLMLIGLHAVWIGLAIYFSRVERPRPVLSFGLGGAAEPYWVGVDLRRAELRPFLAQLARHLDDGMGDAEVAAALHAADDLTLGHRASLRYRVSYRATRREILVHVTRRGAEQYEVAFLAEPDLADLIQRRFAELRDPSQRLLRPAEAPSDAGRLLRPARSVDTPAELLLRPGEEPPREDG